MNETKTFYDIKMWNTFSIKVSFTGNMNSCRNYQTVSTGNTSWRCLSGSHGLTQYGISYSKETAASPTRHLTVVYVRTHTSTVDNMSQEGLKWFGPWIYVYSLGYRFMITCIQYCSWVQMAVLHWIISLLWRNIPNICLHPL